MSRRNPELDALTRENDMWRRMVAELKRDPGDMPVTGCGDTSCIVASPTGMATNGGCRCDPRTIRQAMQYWRRVARFREQTIREMRARASPVVEVLEKLTAGTFTLEVCCRIADTSVTIRAATSEHGAPYHVILERSTEDVLVAPAGSAREAADHFATWLREAKSQQEKT